MSSGEDEGDTVTAPGIGSKRIMHRACDICRRKKIRCDGSQKQDSICSNCVVCKYDCTYTKAAMKRGGPVKGYVESLENRLEKMKKILLGYNSDFSKRSDEDGMRDWLHKIDVSAPDLVIPPVSNDPAHFESFHTYPSARSGTDLEHPTDSLGTRRLRKPPSDRFFDYPCDPVHVNVGNTLPSLQNLALGIPNYEFPEDDLMTELVDLYFRRVNLAISLLHRPTFDSAVADGLHLRDTGFGAIVLLVCAAASRFSDDLRVILPGTGSYHSAGWKWFKQVGISSYSMSASATLYELQVLCISIIYLQFSSTLHVCWTMAGTGIRLAQHIGAHKQSWYSFPLTIEEEMLRRAVWGLVFFDRVMSSNLGRPCAMQDEDFDIDFPEEWPNEYVEDSASGEHSKQRRKFKTTCFVELLKLNQILAFSLRTIYATGQTKADLGFVGYQWEQHIVAELDSALNHWLDDIPDHLRWDIYRDDETFLAQSALLQASYYQQQILTHRPFLSPDKPSPFSASSLAVCNNAARSCIGVIDTYHRRTHGMKPMPYFQSHLFSSGVTLLLNIWGAKRSGLSVDAKRQMKEVEKCMTVLQTFEKRFYSAGRYWDILHGLADVDGITLPQPSSRLASKRIRDSDMSKTTDSFTSSGGLRNATNFENASSVTPAPNPPVALQSNLLSISKNESGLYDQVQGSNDNTRTRNDLWFLTPGNPTAIYGQSHLSDTSASFSGLDEVPVADDMIYGQIDNLSAQAMDGQHEDNFQQLSLLTGADLNQEELCMIDNDTIAIWSGAPSGFETDDWGTFMSQLSYSQH